MRAMQVRSAEEGVSFHAKIEPRVYELDPNHKARVEKIRRLMADALAGSSGRFIVELGAGTGDNCGPFAGLHTVLAVECNPRSADVLKQRFPQSSIVVLASSVELLTPRACDLLVLSEFLEHVADPIGLVRTWAPLANNLVISHPLNEPDGCGLSAGEHQWSFDGSDFQVWFAMAGHTLVESETFQMGSYTIIAGRGERK